MFNFIVAGALERYHSVALTEPAIKPLNAAARAARLGNKSGESHELNFQSDFTVEQKATTTKRTLIEGYASFTTKEQPKLRRRLWLVSDLMTNTVQTLRPEDPLQLAWELLEETSFRHIPITNLSGKLEGLLSDRDLLPLDRDKMSRKPISDVMTKRVLTGFPDSQLREAASIMTREGFSSLPVINESGALVGLLTTSDVLKALVQEAPLDLWA